jgi:P-type E1-E2 ATPase
LSRLLPARRAPLCERRSAASRSSDVAVAQLGVGDRLLVRSGEVVPADGRIESGASQFDESMLTGRVAAGRARDPGDP